MKKTLLFSVALAGLMLGSCSSSDDLNGGGNTGSYQSGNGYVAFTINLPSQPSSRALNDDFKDGLTNEYAVKDATLLLFDGSDESSASFLGAYTLSTDPWTSPEGDKNITTTSKKVVQHINDGGTNAKALVILNNNGIFSVASDGTLTFSGETTSFSGTYQNFLEKASVTSGKTLHNDGFYMANAPLHSASGDATDPAAGSVTTLTNVKNNIFPTKEAALAGTPAQVYVERAVAKVTLQEAASTVTAENGTATGIPFKVLGWCIDNTNSTTYLVRNTDGFDTWKSYANEKASDAHKYRFVGGQAVAAGLYRTYFAKDVNYDSDVTLTRNSGFEAKYGDTNPQYCFENTFDVNHQKEIFTTLVTIKAQLDGGKDFYIVGGDQTKLYPKSELDNLVKAKFMSTQKSWLKSNTSSEVTATDLTVVYSSTTTAGDVTISEITIDPTKLKAGAALPSGYVDEVQKAVGDIDHYLNGESYYTVRIKHFGDDLTPWKEGELGVKLNSIYPTGTTSADNNWLGRYGVLRNNWYDISVTGVKGLGSSKVPSVKPVPDDELDSYIAVKINVLSWAKRTQGATLH